MLPPENYSVSRLSEETGIRKSTLSTWKTKAISGTVSKKTKQTLKRIIPKRKVSCCNGILHHARN